MAMKNYRFLTALLLVLGSAALVGCGDDDAGSSTTTGLTCGTGTVADADNKTCIPDGTATGKTCGAGTVAQGDQCVPDTANPPLECGAGTTEQNGECVPTGTPLVCGAGTTEQNGQCVSDGSGLACGEGTVDNNQGECVPENSFSCGNGTIEDPTTPGSCIRVCPDGTLANANGGCDVDLDLVCSAGTFKFEGKCLSYEEFVREEAAEVITSADSATAQDDPFIYAINTTPDPNLGVDVVTTRPRFAGGTANNFTLPAEGSTTLLEGGVELFASSINGDTIPDQDWDVFAFNATAGQVLNIGAASEGLPVPYVEILHFEGVAATADITTELGDFTAFEEAQDYVRLTPLGQGLTVNRKVVLPKDGLYFLRVTDGSFTPPEIYVCDELDEIFYGCAVGTQILFEGAEGFASGGDGFNYRLSVETLPSIDMTAIPELLLGGAESHTFSGDATQYGRVDEEILMVQKDTGEPGFLEVEVITYDVLAYANGVLATYDPTDAATDRIPQPLGIGQEGLRFSIPVAGTGMIVNHDAIVAQGFPKNGYGVTLRSAPELTEGVGFVSSMEDAPDGDLGVSRDHFFIAPKGSLIEIAASGVGDGITPILALFAYDADQNQVFVGCVGEEGVVDPTVCATVPVGAPLSIARYFPGDATTTETVSAVMFDAETGEGTNFGFTLTPTVHTPTVIALDDLAGIDDVTQNVGGLDSQTGNTTRWAVVTLNPGADPKNLDVTSTPAAGATVLLDSTLYVQAVDSVLALSSASAVGAGNPTTLSTGSPVEPTTYLLKNATSGQNQAATNIEVNASLVTLPSLSGSNDLCATPEVLAGSGTFVVDLFDTAANYNSELGASPGTGCTRSFGAVNGPDSFFVVTVPNGQTLTVDARGVGEGDDPILHALVNTATVCAELAGALATCVATDDDSNPEGNGLFSLMTYTNTSGSSQDILVVLDNYGTPNADSDSNTIMFTVAP